MKKTSLLIAALLLAMTLSTSAVFAETTGRTINLTLGQNVAQIDGKDAVMDAPARLVSSRTLVPLRFIGQAFGCDVDWIASTRTATVTMENQKIEVPIGAGYFVINGKQVAADVPAQLINSSTYVPLRLIGESLGAKVDYDAATKGISMLLNTYKNVDHNFETVLPHGWTVKEETKEVVVLACGTEAEAAFVLASEEDGLDPASFDAETALKEFSGKEGFNYTTEGNAIVAAYHEDGLLNVITYVFFDSGLYVSTFAAPIDSYEDALAQYSIMVSTMKTLDAE